VAGTPTEPCGAEDGASNGNKRGSGGGGGWDKYQSVNCLGQTSTRRGSLPCFMLTVRTVRGTTHKSESDG
jgi:hypothetical protein